uniref:Probable ubiquitin carboxyl-terminal hydrolase creB n=1 Tax=Aspergillus clavatus (strain ATCC 1007 / CBS 513.65 / DSM 816 / NCTC 3887 / NRRL 1 / QM 1276 / 107) TaxID=344612 RepID=CREB_ASPCL|nr:RecName: Full=Probable ubiquitin carboxyl-terminal hydrolase creB; AltName: Full=Carbon catabolite repression protein B; AltName: Full=Deubiquitinating enzyme creB; AltName: Full=Ubiquitin thioesterase creB; AltName: Full=Ubiquitin-hydrolyzing enzyme creB; AltName: Full=Ubiquitin-specific-processing protease creB [Aspergillus clavatus NRRL 1]
MGSFLRSFRNNAGSTTPSVGAVPAKKEVPIPPMTPLEKRLLDMGSIRGDGSDKFYGMENYGNTCYCNSILQCLYYSVPFREAVINYPTRTPIESLEAALAKSLRYPNPNAHLEAEAQAEKQRAANAQRPGMPPAQPQKPEDKDSPDYKKKMALQTLPLLEAQNNATSYGMSESLFTSLKDIFESVVGSQSRIGIVRPQQFLDVLRRDHEMFRTAMHQDAHEFLNLLLNEVVANVEAEASKQPAAIEKSLPAPDHAETVDQSASSGSKTPNTTRWVHELFEGTLTSETQCLTCEKVSQRDEIFLDLSVDLEQHSSVTSCLRKFSAEEMLCERNKFHCDNCGGLQEAEKRMKIKRLPRILALHLKRFKYTEDLQRLQKLFHRVVYPYHLRLFNTTDDAEDPDRLYELYAVVVHIGGGPYHGHYVAIIKTEDRGWLLFDDELVEPVDKNYVRNFFGDKPGLACAYVLFYQETTLEAVMKEQEQENMESNLSATDTNEAALKPNGSSPSHLAHVHSASYIPSLEEHNRPNGLKRAPTAPQLSTHHEHGDPESGAFSPVTATPPVPPIPEHLSAAPIPPKSDVQGKKERAREEKERKAAEKEREKAEKLRRKEQEARAKENQRREEAELKAALEASKASKAQEDRRQSPDHGKDKLGGGLSRLKRGSKSFSQRLGKDKETRSVSSLEAPPLPIPGHPISRDGPIPEQHQQQPDPKDDPFQDSHHPNKPMMKEDEQANHKDPKHERTGHGKWRSFSLRKKSFSILS